MLKTLAATLALFLAAGAVGATSLRVLSGDCDPALATTVGLGASGKICTAGTRRSYAGQATYSAADGAFYQLDDMDPGIVFGRDLVFVGSARMGEGKRIERADVAPRVQGAANGTSAKLLGALTARPTASSQAAGAGMAGVTSGSRPSLSLGFGPGTALSLDGGSSLFATANGLADGNDLDPIRAAPAISSIPLPAAGFLLLGGLGALGLILRRALVGTRKKTV